ncbi:MAG: L-histidine N(alpha)-methyltransferase [Acidimicrobiia bacterium]|nr:L-histidine N(alpha)-methyltransferase [Acidimicrobiia bacterium]
MHLAAGDWQATLVDDLRVSLLENPRRVAPVWFYDERGSELFEQITELAEYYPTRAERELLERHAPDLRSLGADTLVELGSGSSEKTSFLLDALHGGGDLGRYVPFDVSEEMLRGAATSVAARYPALDVHGVVGDFHRHLHTLPLDGSTMVAFLGSTIGNLRPEQRASFLTDLYATLEPGDHLLLGVDLVKDPAVLVAAYDDADDVTAEFNRNALRVLNAEVGADFDPDGFDHVATWNADQEWIEMRLRATTAQRVSIPPLETTIGFDVGDDLLTEISAKFRLAPLAAELHSLGWDTIQHWTTEGDTFALVVAGRR